MCRIGEDAGRMSRRPLPKGSTTPCGGGYHAAVRIAVRRALAGIGFNVESLAKYAGVRNRDSEPGRSPG